MTNELEKICGFAVRFFWSRAVICLVMGMLLCLPFDATAVPRPRLRVSSVQNVLTIKASFRRWKKRFKSHRIYLQTAVEGSGYVQFANLGGRRVTVISVSFLTSGTYKFRARSVDPKGRTSAWTRPRSISIAVTPPGESDPANPSLQWPGLSAGSSECPAGVEQIIHLNVNRQRAKVGLNQLKRRYELDVAARVHSLWMAATQTMVHDGWFEEITSTGLTGRHFAQNIARFITDPEALVNAWMASESHARNILNANYTWTGVSCVVASDGEMYWTQDFGGP